MSRNSFLGVFSAKLALLIFLSGKVIRFSLFGAFIYFLVKGSDSLAGYSLNQTIFFFLTFNLVDVIGQFLFREVYRFRPLVVTGGFDMVLARPVSPLFRVLMGGADVIDLITIPPLIVAIWYVGSLLNPNLLLIAFYLLLLVNGLFIVAAFHIFVLGFGIITLEIDHTIMIFRDLVSLGRFPVDIYREPIKSTLTYLIPVGIMVTLPAKALMGIVSPFGLLISFLVGFIVTTAAYKFWNYALRFYTSASS